MSASRAATPAESSVNLPRDTDASSESDDDTRSNGVQSSSGALDSTPLEEKKEQ